jgi:hypothetical protein
MRRRIHRSRGLELTASRTFSDWYAASRWGRRPRPRIASRIIAKISLASDVMHDLDLSITHQGRDNVGGTLIGGSRPRLAEGEAERLFRLLIRMSSLESSRAVETDLLPLHELRYILSRWSREDHHANDPAHRANFVSKASNACIPARLMHPPS